MKFQEKKNINLKNNKINEKNSDKKFSFNIKTIK